MKRPLFVMAGGFVLGEVLGLLDRSAVVILAAAVTTAAIVWAIRKKDRDGPVLGLLLFFILFGCWRGSAERSVNARELSLRLDGMEGSVSGKVERIREKEDRTEVLIKPQDSDLRYLLVYADSGDLTGERELSVGITVRVSGRYSAFAPATNPGQFDYRSYYRAQKLTYRFFADNVEVLSRRQSLYDKSRDLLRRLSCFLSGVLDTVADPEDAGILRSLLLGDRSGIDADVRELYQKNGISHLLAISGLHLSLISAAVYGTVRRTGAGFGLSGLLSAAVLLAYCIMSGASVSSLRALIMVLLGYLAAFKGRSYDLLTGLGLAGFLLFFDSPYQLTQSGPQLSFLAILGIAAASAENPSGKTKKAGIKDLTLNALRLSLSVQMMTAPVILWNFFRFPLYGVFINLLVLPLMGCVVASGAAGMLAGTFSLTLGRFFIGTAHYILVWYDLLCRFFGRLPGSSLLLGRPTILQTGIYYGTLILLLLYRGGHRDKNIKPVGLIPLFLLLLPLPVMNCNVLFMDVGQGDGILIRTEAGTVLTDGGSSSVKDLYGERLLPCLESLAVSQIDYAIVSHGHADHISGMSMLLGGESPVNVKNLILPAGGRGDAVYEELIQRAEDGGTAVFWMETGDVIEMGRMSLTCLYPDDSGGTPPQDENEHSLVIRLDYGDFAMLTGGDMTSFGEAAILSGDAAASSLSGIQVLKVSHHGSATSSSEPWLDALSPVWAVISYGKGNSYGHPDEGTVRALNDRDITVYETAKNGAVSLRTNGKRIRWDCAVP